MNEGYIATRLHALETNMMKMQERMRKYEFSRENRENSFQNQEKRFLAGEQLCNNEIMMYVDDENNGFKNSENEFFSRVNSTGPEDTEGYLLTFLLNMKKHWLYYCLCAVVYVVCILVSVHLIVTTYESWQSSPVVQATSNNQVPIKNIPFPAVTLCWPDVLRSDYDFIENIQHCLHCENQTCKLTGRCNQTELKTLAFASMICYKYSFDNKIRFDNLFKGHFPRVVGEEEFSEYATKVLPRCEADSLLWSESYAFRNNKIVSRCDSDVEQFISLGPNRICMTLNSLPHTEILQDGVYTTLPRAKRASGTPLWSFDNMMEFSGGSNTTPIYGMRTTLLAMYRPEKRYQDICNEYQKSEISIMIHSPNEIPLLEEISTKVFTRRNSTLNILIEPKIVTARRDLEQYSPQQRGCFYSHEKKLAMFKSYTKNNCLVECSVNTFLSICGCVPLEFPRPNGSVKVCPFFCAAPFTNTYNPNCNCLPDCNSLRYDISTHELDMMQLDVENMTMRGYITLGFQRSMYLTDVRYSITSYMEFLTLGLGVLGAFLGVSVTCVWHLLCSQSKRLTHLARTLWKKKVSPGE